MTASVEIYVKLLEEGTDVWRPVSAEHVYDEVYRISPQPYDRSVERWEFAPGDEVLCQLTDLEDGAVLAAIRRIGGGKAP